jgi:demethylmenaquinone methyltransferase/2-methoxy-6-polyprenyl-1,4-benzoquinol methylase
MSDPRDDPHGARFRPHATQDLAEMFDHVSRRYDVLNSILSLGRDGAWRQAMWRAVPEDARVVLDLCTGSGASLPGLRSPGRLVIGADVSLAMLGLAAETRRSTGWAPRLLCADGFRLPLRGGSVSAITIAFGMRNLRPRGEALAELGRVLAPGGTLVVLEATAPEPGPLAPLHRFYLARVVPAAGRLSDDPTAYRYLAESIFEFGAGPEFEAALANAGFELVERRAFLMGATRLWAARRLVEAGQNAVVSPRPLQSATGAARLVPPGRRASAEWRTWSGVQAALSASLLGALLYAAWTLANLGGGLPLLAWQRTGAWVLIWAGVVVFAIRTVALILRLLSGPPRL